MKRKISVVMILLALGALVGCLTTQPEATARRVISPADRIVWFIFIVRLCSFPAQCRYKNSWLLISAHAMSKAASRPYDRDRDGFTNLEEYLNSLCPTIGNGS